MADGAAGRLRIAFIYTDLPAYVRAKKTLRVLRDLGHEVHYIGCHRRRAWDDTRPEGIHYHISPITLGSGPSTALGLLRFMPHVRRVLRRVRPDVAIAVNEELVLPFTFGYWPKPRHLVMDLYDSIAMRTRGRLARLGPLWRGLSRLAMNTVDALAEVSEARLGWHRALPRTHAVIPNAPAWQEHVDPAPDLPETFVYVSGTLQDRVNGIEPLLAALKRVENMHAVVTGKPLGAFVQTHFLEHPRVHYLGLVPYEEIFRIIAASRGVFLHYAPTQLNYIYGAPNKLYEAMMVGRPVLINAENRASERPRRGGFGLVSPYGDVDALVRDLQRLRDGDPELESAARRQREMYRERYDWSRVAAEAWRLLLAPARAAR